MAYPLSVTVSVAAKKALKLPKYQMFHKRREKFQE